MRRLTKYTLLLALIILLCGCSKQSKEEQLSEGVRLRDAGNEQGAIVLFKSVLDKYPNFFSARYELGSTFLTTGHIENAEKELLKVSVQSPDYRDVNLLLTKAYLATKRVDEAIDFANRQLASHPDDVEAMAQLGFAELLRENDDDAEKLFKQAIEKDGTTITAKIGLAGIYLSSQWPNRAKALLEGIIEQDAKHARAYHMLASLERKNGNTDEMQALFTRLLEKVPTDIRAAKMLGLLHFISGDAKKTAEMASLIAKHHQDSPYADLLFGLSQYLSENYKKALVQLQKAVAKNPDLTGVYFLGLTHFKLGELELALTQFQRSLDLAPNSPHPRLMLAMTYLRQGRTEEAQLEAQRLLDKDPTNAVAYNILGSSLLSAGRFEEGMEALSVATQFNPNLADAHFKKGLYSLKRGGMQDDAEKDLSLALELAPEALNTRLILATQYMKRKDFPKALDTLKEGLNGTKKDAVIHGMMARAYFQQQKMEAAVSELLEAKRIRPGFLDPYYTLAAYYLTKGDHKLALAEYEAMLALAPDNLNALLAAGQTAKLLGDTSKAEEYLKKAAYNGTKTEYRAYVSFLINNGKKETALKVLDNIIKKNPKAFLPLEDKGRFLLSNGKHIEALATFRKLFALAPDIGAKHTVATLLRMGEHGKAVVTAKEVADTNPENHFGHILLASVHQASGDLNQSLQVLDNALGKVDDQRAVRMAISAIYEKMKKPDEARKNLEILLENHPKYVPGLFALGSLENRTGEYGKAEILYKAVLELEPKSAAALNNLAYLYADNYDNVNGALPLAINAYKNAPTNPGVLETLGFVLYKQGRLEQAGQLLEEAKRLLPSNPTINYHLALVYKESDKAAQAAELLRAALEMGDFPERSRAEKLLSSISN